MKFNLFKRPKKPTFDEYRELARSCEFWTLQRLSGALGIDKDLLAKRLKNLEPGMVKFNGAESEQAWYMADVLKHLRLYRQVNHNHRFAL